MRRVVLVTAHFPPGNLTGVHRARIWAQHLPEFGWIPTVVTAHWKYYQEPLDWSLLSLVPNDVCVIRTKALSTRQALFIGNMALRALWWTRKELVRLAQCEKADFVHIIVPDHYSALLGPMLYKSHRLPYGIDYMDPWVHASPREKRFLSKAWFSCALSYYLEPWSVASVRLVTGVSSSTYKGVFDRNPILKSTVETATIPMASSFSDFHALSEGYVPKTKLFDPEDKTTNIVYAGSIPPGFDDSLECFLLAVKQCIEKNTIGSRFRIWLVGTGTSSHGSGSTRVKKTIDDLFLSEYVREYPTRIAYVDALWHVKAASIVLILGSTEEHYTPSKVYQSSHSGNPVLALIPEYGSAAEVLRSSGRGIIVNYPDKREQVIDGVFRALSNITTEGCDMQMIDDENGSSELARISARQLAESLDRVCSH